MRRMWLGRTGAGMAVAAALLCVISLTTAQPPVQSVSRPSLGIEAADASPITGPNGTVDVNTDDPEELTALYGVGETLARRIIDEREANGPYHYPEDLMAVKGISASIVSRNRDLMDFSWAEEP